MSTARFSDRTVWITGAASGLGAATARAFAAEGARVYAVDVNEAGVAETVEAIRSAGGTAEGGRCNVADPASVVEHIDRAVQRFGGLDVLVNVAGIGRFARFEEIDYAEWQRVLDVNLNGAFHTVKAALPHLLARKGGNIVNVASTAGMRGQAYSAPYATSKAGLINFTRSIALEFASRGLRANCIAPAGMKTAILQGFVPREDFERSLVSYMSPPVPHRLSDPADVAKAILFVAAGDVPGLTGATLTVDWGTLA